MEIKLARIVHWTDKHPSSVQIIDVNIPTDPNTPSIKLKFPKRQEFNVILGPNPSFSANVIINGQLELRSSDANWQSGQFSFCTNSPETVDVVTIYRNRQFP